ncbi:hypothetical protein CGLO_14143 [Colletotrichum gloeosporioides Cg-14]|uniref:Uncharacterized protein n=1 Tax=Colletotrichum gloeosporioides (strain Cg-14) TaxID=1237896 RepID=T0L5E2_COLGC|nr:hypothetical protein CGLO_14143 [Colletotrichum gloeosporioides Cg-14]
MRFFFSCLYPCFTICFIGQRPFQRMIHSFDRITATTF